MANYPEEQRQKRKKKNEESLWELYDTMKRNNICIMGIPEEEKEKV